MTATSQSGASLHKTVVFQDQPELEQDLRQIEQKMEVLQHSNEALMTRIRKLARGFERINKCIHKKKSTLVLERNVLEDQNLKKPENQNRKPEKQNRKKSKDRDRKPEDMDRDKPEVRDRNKPEDRDQKRCPPAAQTALRSALLIPLMRQKKIEENPKQRGPQLQPESQSSITTPLNDYLEQCSTDPKPRIRSFSEGRSSLSHLDSSTFPSIWTGLDGSGGIEEMYGSQRSVNTILRLHQSLQPREPTLSSHNTSRDELFTDFDDTKAHKQQKTCSAVRPSRLFCSTQSRWAPSGGRRSPALPKPFFPPLSRISPQNLPQPQLTTKSSSVYLQQPTAHASTKARSMQAESQLDDCIRMLMKLADTH